MQKSEYLEYVEEALQLPNYEEFKRMIEDDGMNPDKTLYCSLDEHRRLQAAHLDYCTQVEHILFPERRRLYVRGFIRAKWRRFCTRVKMDARRDTW